MNDKDPKTDAELDALLAALPNDERDELLEEHRQLEKDLLRLADPLPPADFVHQVMQKVAAAPAPAMSPRDVAMAVVITVATFGAGVVMFLSHGAGFEGVGLTFADTFVRARELFIGVGSALETVWRTAAVPVALGLAAMLGSSVLALKKLGKVAA
ncbi:MAG: hypothetical protein JNK82_45645 [Myxococcaceae bacterium]|nr:hypothetical protein [Myxococcaceae bacterium]